MKALRTMMHMISGRRAERAREQADVDRALSLQRAELRRQVHEFREENQHLRSAESRMMDALAGLAVAASRTKQ